jgi:TatD DNase family protein
MILFDTHCHLQDKRIFSDIESIISRAQKAGVEGMLCCGSSEDDWGVVLEISKKYGFIKPAFGIHPWYVSKRSDKWFETLVDLLIRTPDASIGEIGLDHTLSIRNDGEQLIVFKQQLQLATRLQRPVSIHCRKAWGDLQKVLNQEQGLPSGGAVHSYSGAPDLIRTLIGYGLSISFSGSITNLNNKKVRESVLSVPSDYLLIESDSPDIPSAGFSGNNEPANICSIVNTIASLKNRTPEEIAEITFNNGMGLFT